MNDATLDPAEPIHEPRLWRDNGWTARVIKNEDDEGWAVAMVKDGEPEPALVGPWTMGRDKKNPKPLDTAAFNTLVKTASEVIRRLADEMIEARPVWKPMHLQPVFEGVPVERGSVAEAIFDRGVCLPSGSAMTDGDVDRVVEAIRRAVVSG